MTDTKGLEMCKITMNQRMEPAMVRIGHYKKIFYSIVSPIAVNMMNYLISFKGSAKKLFHYIPMFSNSFSINRNMFVSIFIQTAISLFIHSAICMSIAFPSGPMHFAISPTNSFSIASIHRTPFVMLNKKSFIWGRMIPLHVVFLTHISCIYRKITVFIRTFFYSFHTNYYTNSYAHQHNY